MGRLSARTKQILTFILKLVISGAAIAFVVTKIDMAETWQKITSVDWRYLLGALVIYTLSQILSAMRLNTLFVTLPLTLGSLMNIRLYWLGMFYNFFLPGGIGGDGYKVYYLKKHYRQSVKDLVRVILDDRLSGLAVILVYLLLFTSLGLDELPLPYREFYWVLVPFVLLGYYLFLYLTCKESTAVYFKVILYSFVVQGLQMAAASLILVSLAGWNASILNYMFLFLASSIASAIPVTLGGIGAREMAFMLGSSYLGTSEAIALSLCVLFYLTSLVSAIPGLSFVVRPSLIEGKTEHKGSHLYQS
jgi:uncharacterized membrane protein YbhN (UPF0104 family)